jgi:hypothetical protein
MINVLEGATILKIRCIISESRNERLNSKHNNQTYFEKSAGFHESYYSKPALYSLPWALPSNYPVWNFYLFLKIYLH